MRLIDDDKLKNSDFQDFSDTDVFYAIDSAPTVNVVEVVRCKKCKYGTPVRSGSVLCGHPEYELLEGALTYGEDHFCAYGERRE